MSAAALADAVEAIVSGGVALTARALAHTTHGLELTFPQWRVLVVLGQVPSGLRISIVAARISGSLPATSRLLQRLARRGLVELSADPDDGRATLASLTSEGWAIRAAIVAYRRTFLDELITDVEASEEVAHTLGRLAAALATAV